jgi:hypothetical protein
VSKERRQSEQLPEFSIDHIANLAQETLLRDGYHSPTLFVQDDENKLVVAQLAELPPTHEDKLQYLFQAGFMLSEQSPISSLKQVFFVTEAWLSQARDGKLPLTRPSLDPQRKEVLIISTLHLHQSNTQIAVYEMLRDPDGNLRELQTHHEANDVELNDNPLLSAFATGFLMAHEQPDD